MARRKTLAEELAELATTLPTQECDPDACLFEDVAAMEGTDDELGEQPGRSKGREKGLRLRQSLELDDRHYAGRTVSRAAAFGKEDDGGSGAREDSGSEEEARPSGDSSDDVPEEEPAGGPRRLRAAEQPDDDDSDDAGPIIANGLDDDRPAAVAFLRGPDNDSDVGDEDAAALEREFEAARAHDAGAVSALAERAAKEKAKGMAIASQKALWERTLELRILLQRCVQAANRLPRPGMHAAARAQRLELRSGFAGLCDGAAATLDTLLDLQDALLNRIPACRADASGAADGPAARAAASAKRGRSATADDEDDASLPASKWARADAAYRRFAPYRDASLDRWHRKTLLMTGAGAMRGSLRALNQSLSSQVAALVKNKGPAVARTQLPMEASMPLMGRGGNALQDGAAAAAAEHADEEDGSAAAPRMERDAETFDDGEFYAQLLKEFLEGSSSADAAAAGSAAALAKGKKKRRAVERRASKGRKLRYQVMDKLVHFMAPVPRAQPPALAVQLFANLFGQPAAGR